MKYNKKSPYEKPLNECPRRCSDCSAFGVDFCRANDVTSVTCSFSNPKDRPVPFPLNCFWWYTNNVFDKMSESKIREYTESRIHLFTAYKLMNSMQEKERKSFWEHFYRRGGGQLIDFEKYPQAKRIYDEIAKTEK